MVRIDLGAVMHQRMGDHDGLAALLDDCSDGRLIVEFLLKQLLLNIWSQLGATRCRMMSLGGKGLSMLEGQAPPIQMWQRLLESFASGYRVESDGEKTKR